MNNLTTEYLNPMFGTALQSTLLGIYGAKANPEIPQVNKIFNNPYVKYIIIFMIAYLQTHDVKHSGVITAIVFGITYYFKKQL